METVVIMEITSLDSRKGIVSFQRKFDPNNILPEKVTLAKNLPAFKDDFNYLSEFCLESSQRFMEKLIKK